MEKNYFVYPTKYMNITQTYKSTYSHYPHTTGTPKDYPIDEAGNPSGEKSAVYCNCDELEVTAIRGLGNKNVTNTIWLVSTTPVVTPTFTDYAFVTYTHPNDEDLKNIKVGQKFKRGEIITYEGTDGASGPHVHIVCGRGKSSNWTENSNHKWVMVGDCKKPEEVFYVDPTITKIYKTGGLEFKTLPNYLGTPVERDEQVDQIEVKVEKLRVRKTPNGEILGYINLGIYNILEKEKNGDYTWIKIGENMWIAYQETWETIYPKKEIEELTLEVEELKKALEQCQNEYEKTETFSFVSPHDGNYYIYLRANETLKIYSND